MKQENIILIISFYRHFHVFEAARLVRLSGEEFLRIQGISGH